MRRASFIAPGALALTLGLVATLPRGASASEREVQSRTADVPLSTLASLTKWGEVVLVEPNHGDQKGQVALFGWLDAPPKEVFAAIADVSRYPEFIETMTHIRVLDDRDGLTAYRWVASVPPLVKMDGIRLQRTRPPHVVEVRGHSGHLRGTRERFEIHPARGGTLVAMYRALDLDTGHLLLRTLSSVDPSMEQGINMATLLIHFRGLRAALTQSDGDADAPASPGVSPLPVQGELAALGPWLDFGTVLLVQSTKAGVVGQVVLTELVEAPSETLTSVIREADRWPEFIDSLESQTMTPVGPSQWDLDWKISIPMGSIHGRSRMTLADDGAITVDTISGDIKSGQAHWAVREVDAGRSLLVHHSYSDLRDASWLLGMLLNAEPFLEHGILGAAGTLAVTRMGARAEELSRP